jgi:hypothetical protein
MKKTRKNYSLTYRLSKYLQKDESSDEFENVFAAYISHITKGISAFQFQKRIAKHLPENTSAKIFRLRLAKNKYNFFTLKLFIFQLPKIRNNDLESVKALAESLGVKTKDSERVYKLWLCSPNLRRRVKAIVKEFSKQTDYSIEGLETQFFDYIFPIVYKKIKSVTYYKLRFIAKSSNLDLTDLESELTFKALQTYYTEVPTTKNIDHVINYIKRAVHNHAMNMINSAVSKKRGRLICVGFDKNNERVFSQLVMSENQFRANSVINTNSSLLNFFEYLEETEDPTNNLENEICVTTILNKYKQDEDKYRLLSILMGKLDVKFTEWLLEEQYCVGSEDNRDLQDKIHINEYRRILGQYFRLGIKEVNIFLLKLGKSISGEGNEVTTKNPLQRSQSETYPVSKYYLQKKRKKSNTG